MFDQLILGAHRREHLLRAGIGTHELRGPLWRPTGSGRHAFIGTDPDDPRQRVHEAAARLPPPAAVGGWAAAHLHGAVELDGQHGQPVLVCLTPQHHLSAGAGLQFSRSRLHDEDVVTVDGIRATSLVRTAFDLARLIPDVRGSPGQVAGRPRDSDPHGTTRPAVSRTQGSPSRRTPGGGRRVGGHRTPSGWAGAQTSAEWVAHWARLMFHIV